MIGWVSEKVRPCGERAGRTRRRAIRSRSRIVIARRGGAALSFSLSARRRARKALASLSGGLRRSEWNRANTRRNRAWRIVTAAISRASSGERGIDRGELVAGALAVEDSSSDRVDQRLLGREGAEDGALGDARGLGDLPGADVAAELLQQRLGRGDEWRPGVRRAAGGWHGSRRAA